MRVPGDARAAVRDGAARIKSAIVRLERRQSWLDAVSVIRFVTLLLDLVRFRVALLGRRVENAEGHAPQHPASYSSRPARFTPSV
jgi:hypothetical protein